MKIYSVYDRKSKSYKQPMTIPLAGEALRGFIDCCTDGKHMFSKWPHDFDLYQVGSFDDLTGKIDPCNILLANGGDFEKPNNVVNLEKGTA